MESVKRLVDDYRESVDVRSVFAGAAFVAWVFVQFGTTVPYVYGLRWNVFGISVVPSVLFLGIGVGVSILPQVFQLRSERTLGLARLGFSVVLSAGSVLLFPLGEAYENVQLCVALALIALGFSGVAACFRYRMQLSTRRLAVTLCSVVLLATVLSVIVLIVPRWLGIVLYVFFPVISGALSLSSLDKESEADQDGALPDARAVRVRSRAAAGQYLSLGVVGVLFSLAFQTNSLHTVYDGSMFGGNEGIQSLLLVLVMQVLYIVYLLKTFNRQGFRRAFMPVGISLLLGFFLPFLYDRGLEVVSIAMVFAGTNSYILCAWLTLDVEHNPAHASPRFVPAICRAMAAGLLIGQVLVVIMFWIVPADHFVAVSCAAGLFLIGVQYWFLGDAAFPIASVVAREQQAEGEAPTCYGIPILPSEKGNRTAVESFSERAGLTQRELEVMQLLMRGRNLPYICDELVIAKSTVQTHIKHIYAKFSVGNRQELLDAFEAFLDEDSRER